MNEYEIIAETWRRERRLDVIEWVKAHVMQIPYSPRAFTLDEPPMLAEILREIVRPANRRVMIVACVQSGKTLAPELALTYLIKNVPAPALWLNQTDAEAKDQAEGRLKQLFDVVEPVKKLYNPDRNKMRRDTMIFNNGMTLWTLGQNNMRNLQRRSICYVFGDETWQWERGRIEEVAARTTAFAHRKCVFMSQAGESGDDTETTFLSTDRREWTWVCPKCGNDWTPQIEHFDPDNATMTCPHCSTVFKDGEFERQQINRNARFVAQNTSAARGRVGFHWNCFSTMPWSDIAALYSDALDASERGNDEPLKQFFQKRLALPWQADYDYDYDASETKKAVGYRLREPWSGEAEKHFGDSTVRLRFLTVDVQQDHFYWVIRLWGNDGRSRLYDCGIAQTFDEISQIMNANAILPRLVGIDCGFRTDEVFEFCAKTGATALRGDKKNGWDFKTQSGRVEKAYSPKEIIQVAPRSYCGRHFFSDLRCKDILANLRSRDGDRWTYPDNAPKNYEKMLYSEKKNEKGVWEQIGRRPNHFLDCEAMQICFALMLGLV